MSNQVVKPGDVHAPWEGAYNHAVRAGTVYVAGQVALDRDGNVVGKDDIVAQAELALTNLSRVLAAAGASNQNVVKLNVYLTRREDFTAWREVRRRYFTGEPPAATLAFVSGLADPDLLVEVEAIAVTG